MSQLIAYWAEPIRGRNPIITPSLSTVTRRVDPKLGNGTHSTIRISMPVEVNCL